MPRISNPKTKPKKKTTRSSRLGHDPFSDALEKDVVNDYVAQEEVSSPSKDKIIEQGKPDVLELPSNFTIAGVTEAYSEIKSLLDSSNNEIEIDPSNLDSIDTAGMQLLYAVSEKLKLSKKSINWTCGSKTIENASDILGIKILNINE
ncbi:hypothetical protein MNBD_GAMMA25-2104 [hydrothermal vent metagenome]|uniref:STAS domain-containing protein n=1 Tax=hydrothermal vent metagenome TaxID=652676 RepID=A0A3B1BM67_9ZZZZ